MKYQETGRFGRITKNLRKQNFESEMKKILHDSTNFTKLKKNEQTEYVSNVVDRMANTIGVKNAEKILFNCGAQCCGKSWSKFVKDIWDNSKTLNDFFINLNNEESKYNTKILYNASDNSITVKRSKCICGLINKGKLFTKKNLYCKCSIGHMSIFFNTISNVENITLNTSIFNGDDECKWTIKLNNKLNESFQLTH